MTKRSKPIVLTVLDGWGYRAETRGNAIALARKPAYDRLIKDFPNTLIQTSGPAVGLPEGQMGNSEVGHLNIGAGRIVHMDITKMDLMVANQQLDQVPLFQKAMERGRLRQLHFLGLLSDGGVHSHIQHLFALLETAKRQKVETVFVHCFMDGRDTPPHSGRDFVQQLQQKMRELGVGKIATLIGRYYAMDRDNRWERIELAYRAMVHGEAETRTSDPVAALKASYEAGVTDEFVKPVVVMNEEGSAAKPAGLIRDDDAVIFYNFRADRARQMTYALAAPDFDKFVDAKRPKNLFYVAMTQYDKNWPWLKPLRAACWRTRSRSHVAPASFSRAAWCVVRTMQKRSSSTCPTRFIPTFSSTRIDAALLGSHPATIFSTDGWANPHSTSRLAASAA